MPGDKPPAWAAGESVPWPTPGERAAEELSGEDDEAEPPAEGSGPALPAAAPDSGGAPSEPGSDEPKRKRKQRD